MQDNCLIFTDYVNNPSLFNRHPAGSTMKFQCSVCTNIVSLKKSRAKDKVCTKRNLTLYCSKQCHYPNNGNKSTLCRNCGTKVTKTIVETNRTNNTFCSRSCAATFNNKAFPKRSRGEGPMYVGEKITNGQLKSQHMCLYCSLPIKRNAKLYCSHKCFRMNIYEIFIQKWKDGLESGNKSNGCCTAIRKYLFIKYNSSCSECGWSKTNSITGKIPLDVDHIDGNYKNNKEMNLRLLCGSCHSLTSNYKALNKGNGRERRYKARPEGIEPS